ncbi:MAG TPA: hypothetical protein VIJ15_14505 [Dermatophilaceae bacterium]
MPGSFRAAVRAELGQAFSSPYLVPSTVVSNAFLMVGAWFLLPRGWLFTITSPLAFSMVLASWMYSDVPATNVLAPDRVRVLAALGDSRMLTRLLVAKAAVLWLFVAPFCSLLAIAIGLRQHDMLIIITAIVAICVVPVGCLPVAALVGIRWPYHPLQLKYRWEHRHPVSRMIVRWAVLVLLPYILVPALAILMTVPALVLIIRADEGNSHVVNFINAFGENVGIHVAVGTRPLSTAMFMLSVAMTCGMAVLTWLVGRWADLRLIERRRAELADWLADPTMG